MPTISKSRVQPVVTPVTALFSNARDNPWTAACESFSRTATRCPSFCSMLTPCGIRVSSLPFGPCTSITLPRTLTFTPDGIAIGFLPILDIAFLFSLRWLEGGQPSAVMWRDRDLSTAHRPRFTALPNFAQNLATDAGLARVAARHHALGRGQDVDSQSTQNAWNLGAADIHAAAWLRD